MVQAFNGGLRPPARTLQGLLFRLQYLAGRREAGFVDKLDQILDVPTVDEELSLLFTRFDEREVEILRTRFAVGKRPTLDDLGIRFGVSRERIRQIEKTIADQLRNIYYFELPLLKIRTAMLVVRISDAVSPVGIFDVLHRRGIVDSEPSINDFLAVWRAIDFEGGPNNDDLARWRVCAPRNYAFPEGIASFAKTGLAPKQQASSSTILTAAAPIVRQVGAVTPAYVVGVVGDPRVSEEDVVTVFAANGMQEILHGYWARPVGKPVPRTVARKMIAVCGPLNLRQLRRGLLRHQRRQGFPTAPIAVLRAMFKDDGEFVVDPDDVVRLQEPNVRVKLGEWERIWVELVRGSRPVIHTDRVHKAFELNGLRPITAYVLLRKSSLVEPLGKQLFTLPGIRVADEDVIHGKSQAIKIDSNSVLTYDEAGDVLFETTSQQYMDRNGTLSSGPANVMKGRWKTVIDGEEIGEFTVGQPWIYGLSGARETLDLRAGDRVGIRFDTWTRRGHVYVVGRARER